MGNPTLFLAKPEYVFFMYKRGTMSAITDTVKQLATPIAQRHECEIWDVEYVKEAGNWYLRVYIDRPDGISIKHCESVNHDLDAILDENETLIPGSYIFEVSSAGVERKLRNQADFARFSGHLVEIKLYKSRDGKKAFQGNLSGWNDGQITLDISETLHTFLETEVAGIWLRLGDVF